MSTTTNQDGIQPSPISVRQRVATFLALDRTKDSGDGHWVTIGGSGEHEGHGVHVFIKGGRITKGPSALEGKRISELPEGHHVTAHHGEKHPVTGTKEGPKGDSTAGDARPAKDTKSRVAELLKLNTEKYQAANHPNPAAAAQYAVEGILTQYKNQPEHLAQLLDEEIEDARKAKAKTAVAPAPASPEFTRNSEGKREEGLGAAPAGVDQKEYEAAVLDEAHKIVANNATFRHSTGATEALTQAKKSVRAKYAAESAPDSRANAGKAGEGKADATEAKSADSATAAVAPTVKSVAHAAEVLKSYGVKETDLRSNLFKAQLAVNAVAIAKHHGFDAPDSIVKTNGDAIAYASHGGIGIGKRTITAKGMEATVAGGHLSQPNPILHEIAHVAHERHDKAAFGRGDNFRDNTRDRAIAAKVSKYAQRNPKEFVAETLSGMMAGKSYPEDVMTMYRSYGGPPLKTHLSTAYYLSTASTLAEADTTGLPTDHNGLPIRFKWVDSAICGDWKHPKTGQAVDITPERTSKWVSNLKLALSRKVDVPAVKDHKETADASLGAIYDARASDDGRLQLLVGFYGDDALAVAQRNKVSVGVDPDFRDSYGNSYGEAIRHLAFTPMPVIHGQQGFLAASRDQDDEAAYLVPVAHGEPMKLNDTERARVAKTIGVEDFDEDTVVDLLADTIDTLNEEKKAVAAELSAAQTKYTELSASVAEPVVIDNEALRDRAENYETKIELSCARGDMPKFIADKLKSLVKPKGTPNTLLLSTAADTKSRPIDDILALFADAKLGKPTGETTGTQSVLLSREIPDGEKDKKQSDVDAQVQATLAQTSLGRRALASTK